MTIDNIFLEIRKRELVSKLKDVIPNPFIKKCWNLGNVSLDTEEIGKRFMDIPERAPKPSFK